jgi:DnaJ-class molecular chaperone
MNALPMLARCAAGQRGTDSPMTWRFCGRCDGTGLVAGWTCVACGGLGNVTRLVPVATETTACGC